MCRQGLRPRAREQEHWAVSKEVLLPWQSSPRQQPRAGPSSTLAAVLAPPRPPCSTAEWLPCFGMDLAQDQPLAQHLRSHQAGLSETLLGPAAKPRPFPLP